MPRYFISDSAIANSQVTITGGVADHLAGSRRARSGEEIEVADQSGRAHRIRLTKVTKSVVCGDIVESRPASGEPELDAIVLQALCKDGMDEAVDATVAAGAAAIMPITTEHTVVHLDARRAAARHRHWQEVARQAAQVAYRGSVPEVYPVKTLAAALGALDPRRRILACAMAEDAVPLSELKLSSSERIALVIGPEGGLSERDLLTLRQHDCTTVHLGPRVFRARLAASHALSLCMQLAGQLFGLPGRTES